MARGHGGLSGGRKTNRPVCGATPVGGWLPVSGQIISSKRRRPRPSAPLPFFTNTPPRRRGFEQNDKWSVGVQTGAALAPHAATFCVPPALVYLVDGNNNGATRLRWSQTSPQP